MFVIENLWKLQYLKRQMCCALWLPPPTSKTSSPRIVVERMEVHEGHEFLECIHMDQIFHDGSKELNIGLNQCHYTFFICPFVWTTQRLIYSLYFNHLNPQIKSGFNGIKIFLLTLGIEIEHLGMCVYISPWPKPILVVISAFPIM